MWQRSVIPAVQTRAIHAAPVIGEAKPASLEGDKLTLEFPPSADFHRKLAEEKYQSLLRDALYEVTGRRLELEFALGENGEEPQEEEPASEEDFVALVKETFDAREVEEVMAGQFDMNKLMQQAQQMQAQMAKAQEELAHETVEASAGGGMVTVTATGAGEITEIKIDPKAIDPDDPDLLQDLVLAAVNEALRSAQALAQSKLGGSLGSLGLPGLS